MPTPENANSLILVLATITAPAARRRRTTGASALAGGASAQDLRTRARRLALDVEQILDADDRAVEGAERYALLGACIGGIRGGARRIGVEREAGARALALRIGDTDKRLLETVANRRHVITGRSTTS